MTSDFAEYCLHIQQLQTKIARFAIWINIPIALLNFILVQLNDLDLLPIDFESTPTSWTLSLLWFVVSTGPLMLLSEFWEMWWNPFARNVYGSQSGNIPEKVEQSLLQDNRRVVKRAFCIAV